MRWGSQPVVASEKESHTMPLHLQRSGEPLDQEKKNKPKLVAVWKLLLLWLIPALALGGFFTSRLAQVVHPWEHVLHIPNGVTDDPMSGRWIGTEFDLTSIAINSNDSWLTFGRATGDVEIWDLRKLKHLKTLELPDPVDSVSQDNPWQTAPNFLQFDKRGHLFLLVPRQTVFEFDSSGDLVTSRNIDTTLPRALSISPQGDQLAYAILSPKLQNWPESEKRAIPSLEHLNGGNQRFQWLPDGQHFLFNDSLSVSLVDTREERVLFRHFGLGEDLPEAPQADPPRRKWTGFHYDSRLVMDGSCFVTAYTGSDLLDVAPEYRAIRFYETLTGKALTTYPLPEDPRSLSVSGNGLVAVNMVIDEVTGFENLLYLFDSDTMEKVGELNFKLINSFPPRIQLSPDHTTLFVGSNLSWLVDLDDKAAPVKILDSPSNTQRALFTSDGDTLVAMQMNMDVDVWKKRRELNPLGALIHWKYWAVHLVCFTAFLGLTIQIGRRTSILHRKRLPMALWIVLLAIALGLGQRLAGLLLDQTLYSVWGEGEPTSVRQMIWKSLILLFWLRILVGLTRLEPAWRKVALVLLFLGALILTGLFAWLTWLIFQVPADLLAHELQGNVFDNGWKPGFTQGSYLVAIFGGILLVLASWWLLFRSSSREHFLKMKVENDSPGL